MEFVNGKPTGRCQFSCGDGKLYTGTLNEIKEQLQTNTANASSNLVANGLAIINNLLNPKPSPAQVTKDFKQRARGEVQNNQEHTSPTPLSTTPNPLNRR